MTNNKNLSGKQISSINLLIDSVNNKQLKDFGKINSEEKPDGSLITECDRWSDKTIVAGLNEITPGEGVLSEEGSKIVPNSDAYWIVDPLDGTTNFAAGIPYWSISIARFVNGYPESCFLDIPSLNKRFIAIQGKGVLLNNKKISSVDRNFFSSECVSLCSRSIKILQKNPSQKFPGKIRLLGVSSLNMTSVAIGQTYGAIEATPKIWDIAAAWLILKELKCLIKWLEENPSNLNKGSDLSAVNFPLIASGTQTNLERLNPWGELLIKR
tara:strand:+ start:8979 stop:9785 length:807 start_codon:yes stop_codon:yes gene_type:complete